MLHIVNDEFIGSITNGVDSVDPYVDVDTIRLSSYVDTVKVFYIISFIKIFRLI